MFTFECPNTVTTQYTYSQRILSPLCLNENQWALPQILSTYQKNNLYSYQCFLPNGFQAGSYKCSKDITFQGQGVHIGLYILLPKHSIWARKRGTTAVVLIIALDARLIYICIPVDMFPRKSYFAYGYTHMLMILLGATCVPKGRIIVSWLLFGKLCYFKPWSCGVRSASI